MAYAYYMWLALINLFDLFIRDSFNDGNFVACLYVNLRLL